MTALATSAKLAVANVSHSFPAPDGESARPVLDGVTLDLAAGEIVCVVGASGCGKTTLLRIMAGLVAPSDGAVLLDGVPLDGPSRECGFVFQSDALMPWRTVAANVGVGLEVRGIARDMRQQQIADALRMVGLGHWGQHFPSELSGGMRQRVNIARAVAIHPSVLLMDEPFAALDAQTREIMQEELLGLCERLHATVVFVTHQIEEAVFLGDRVIVLASSPGRVREIVAPELPRPRHTQTKRTPHFAAITDHVWSLIANDVQANIRNELGCAS